LDASVFLLADQDDQEVADMMTVEARLVNRRAWGR
jgi:hypothetical protein